MSDGDEQLLEVEFIASVTPDLAIGFVFDPSKPSAAHDLVFRARSGDHQALALVLTWSTIGLRRLIQFHAGTLLGVPVPSHDPARRNVVAEFLVAAWTRQGLMLSGSGSLRRTALAPIARTNEGLDSRSISRTLSWSPPATLSQETTVVLVDDVLKSGTSIQACRYAIERDPSFRKGRPVPAIVVARADRSR